MKLSNLGVATKYAVITVIRVFALCFMIAFTANMCYIYLKAVQNGGMVTIYTNIFGEQHVELWIIGFGVIAMIIYVPALVRNIAKGES